MDEDEATSRTLVWHRTPCGEAACSVRGVVAIAVSVRIALVILVGWLIGLVVGSIRGAIIAAAIGVLLADLAWISFNFAAFSIGPKDAVDVAVNPIVVVALIACPAAAAESRRRAITIGLSLSVVVPVAVAAIVLLKTSPDPGSGLARALTVIVALMAVFTGAAGTLIARAVYELATHYARITKDE